MLWLLQELEALGVKVTPYLSGSRISCLRAGRLWARDSWQLLRASLDDAASWFGLRKPRFPLTCRCEQCPDYQGYCRLRRDLPLSELASVADYLRGDCDVLDKVLRKTLGWLDGAGVTPRGTLGGTAWKNCERVCKLGPSPFAEGKLWRDYRFARSAYAGGRTELYRFEAPRGDHFDIVGAYVSTYDRDFPVGRPLRAERPRDAERLYRQGRPGIYRASVVVPESRFPPLPIHVGDRLAFCHGRLVGSWALPELQAAEERGAVVSVREALWFPEGARAVLKPFLRLVWDARSGAPVAGLAKVAKGVGNALSGRLAHRPDGQVIAVTSELPKACHASYDCSDGRDCGLFDCCAHKCMGKCGRWYPLGPMPLAWSKPTWHLADWAYIHWACYITAYTRIRQLEALERTEPLYSATDAVFVASGTPGEVGRGLGQWEHESAANNWRARDVGVYTYDDGKVQRAVVKGIPRELEAWRIVENGEELVDTRGAESFRRALGRGRLFTRRVRRYRVRSHPAFVASRRVVGNETESVTVAEFAAHLATQRQYVQG